MAGYSLIKKSPSANGAGLDKTGFVLPLMRHTEKIGNKIY